MTIEQKQCLLRYLGYYAGIIDGIWGGHLNTVCGQF